MRKWAKIQDDIIEKVEILQNLFDIINDPIPEESQAPEIGWDLNKVCHK